MIAVLAAFFFWKLDREASTERQVADISHDAARELITLNYRIRQAASGSIYQGNGRRKLKWVVAQRIRKLKEQARLQQNRLQSGQVAEAIDAGLDFLETDEYFDAYLKPWTAYDERVRIITEWMDRQLERHLNPKKPDPGPLPGRDALERAWDELIDNWDSTRALYDRQMERDIAQYHAGKVGATLPETPANGPKVHKVGLLMQICRKVGLVTTWQPPTPNSQ